MVIKGKNVWISPRARLIGDKIVIGDGSIIDENVIIYNNVQIGKNVYIGCGSIIGTVGYRLVKNPKEAVNRKGVVVGSNIFIGSYCVIERGVMTDTYVGNNVVMNSNCYISSDAKIADNCKLENNVYIGSCANLGSGCIIYTKANIGEGVSLAKDTMAFPLTYVYNSYEQPVQLFGCPEQVIKGGSIELEEKRDTSEDSTGSLDSKVENNRNTRRRSIKGKNVNKKAKNDGSVICRFKKWFGKIFDTYG